MQTPRSPVLPSASIFPSTSPQISTAKNKPKNEPPSPFFLNRLSPIEWDNVILYGQYVLDRDRVR